jgi:hypothetical protein
MIYNKNGGLSYIPNSSKSRKKEILWWIFLDCHQKVASGINWTSIEIMDVVFKRYIHRLFDSSG